MRAIPVRTNPYPFFGGAFLFIAAVSAGILIVAAEVQATLAVYLSINVAAFSLCGFDKGAAAAGSLRVPESILIGAATVGGAVGLLLGIRIFRHKKRKAGFVALTGFLVVAQLAALMYLQRIGYIDFSLSSQTTDLSLG